MKKKYVRKINHAIKDDRYKMIALGIGVIAMLWAYTKQAIKFGRAQTFAYDCALEDESENETISY